MEATERKLGRAFLISAAAALITVGFASTVFAQDAPGTHVDELLMRARELNPELAAAALESDAAAAMVRSAGALEDPSLNLTRDQGFRQTLVTVSQDFPLWGKRDLKRKIAGADAAGAKAREAAVWRTLEERIKVTFAEYLEVDRSLRTTTEIHTFLHAVSGTARARYAQGIGAQEDAIRADLEQVRLLPQISRLEANKQAIKARLNALIGRSSASPLAEPANLRAIPAARSLRLDDLVARARDNNPAIMAARAETTAADGERRLVDKSWYPDVTVSVGTSDLPDMSPRPVAGVGIKIPLQWGTREAQADAASAKQRASQARIQAALLDIESELRAMQANLAQAQRTRELLSGSVMPQSEAAYRSALASYERGRGDLATVLVAAHQQLEIRIELLRVETEEQTAFAAIERIVGDDL